MLKFIIIIITIVILMMKKSQEFLGFVRRPKMNFHLFARHRNESVDLTFMMFCACEWRRPAWVGRSNGLNFVLSGRSRMLQPYIESATARYILLQI